MLLCKNRSRDQIDNLLVLLHCLECCPDCNLCLSSEDKAKKLYEEYRFLNENTSYYPAKDLLFYQADIHGKQLVK